MLFVDEELFVRPQNNFGRQDYYPDCEWSTFFCKIHGTSVLPPALLRELKRQGFTITVKTQQL